MKGTSEVIKGVQAIPLKRIWSRRLAAGWLNIALIVVLVATFVFSAGFFPVLGVSINKPFDVPYEEGVDRLGLSLTTDVGDVDVRFEPLQGKMITLNVSVTGKTGLFATNLFDLAFDSRLGEDALLVALALGTSGRWPWYEPGWLSVKCDVCIDPSLSASVSVATELGNVTFLAQDGAILDSLSVESSEGDIEIKFSRDAVLRGNVTVKGTADVDFAWEDVIVENGVKVELEGGIREPYDFPWVQGNVKVSLIQERSFAGNVSLKARATIGEVHFAILIRDGVSAKIQSVSLSGMSAINITNYAGFTGYTQSSKSPLHSGNYPAESNFDVILKTDTGDICVDSVYNP